MTNGYTKTLPEVVNDLKLEFREFFGTRLAMFRSEMQGKLSNIKMAVPVIALAAVVLLTGWFLFSAFLVCAIAMAFSQTAWNYAISALIVSVLYFLVGMAAGVMGWRQIRQAGLKPERTLRVLKQDQVWLQTEAKTHV